MKTIRNIHIFLLLTLFSTFCGCKHVEKLSTPIDANLETIRANYYVYAMHLLESKKLVLIAQEHTAEAERIAVALAELQSNPTLNISEITTVIEASEEVAVEFTSKIEAQKSEARKKALLEASAHAASACINGYVISNEVTSIASTISSANYFQQAAMGLKLVVYNDLVLSFPSTLKNTVEYAYSLSEWLIDQGLSKSELDDAQKSMLENLQNDPVEELIDEGNANIEEVKAEGEKNLQEVKLGGEKQIGATGPEVVEL